MIAAAGFVFDDDHLDWEPLEMLMRATSARHRAVMNGDFMWMGAVDLVDGRRIHQYKHEQTRRYLRLDEQGHAVQLIGDDYVRHASPDDAIADLELPAAAEDRAEHNLAVLNVLASGPRLVP